MTVRLLLVVDDPRAAQPLAEQLLRARLQSEVCLGLRSALEKLRQRTYDAVVLDLPLAAPDAVRLALELRLRTETPVVFLPHDASKARSAATLATSGIGYPPFHDGLDVARITAEPRRPSPLRFGRFSIDLAAMRAARDGGAVALTPTEFKLLIALAERPGEVLSREELLLRVWSYANGEAGRLVDVHIGRLRKRLAGAGVSEVEIETARGFGYRLTTKTPLTEVR